MANLISVEDNHTSHSQLLHDRTNYLGRFTGMPLELITMTVGFCRCEDVLALCLVNRTFRRICWSKTVFKAVLENGNGRPSWEKFVFRCIPPPLHDCVNVDVWARYALMDSKAASLAYGRESLSVTELNKFITWLPQCALLQHPAVTREDSKAVCIATISPADTPQKGWLQMLILRLSHMTDYRVLCIGRRLAFQRRHSLRSEDLPVELWNYKGKLKSNNCIDFKDDELQIDPPYTESFKALVSAELSVDFHSAGMLKFCGPPKTTPFCKMVDIPVPFSNDVCEKVYEPLIQFIKHTDYVTQGEWTGYIQERGFFASIDDNLVGGFDEPFDLATCPPVGPTVRMDGRGYDSPALIGARNLRNDALTRITLDLTVEDKHDQGTMYTLHGWQNERSVNGRMHIFNSSNKFFTHLTYGANVGVWAGVCEFDGLWARKVVWTGEFDDVLHVGFTPNFCPGTFLILWKKSWENGRV